MAKKHLRLAMRAVSKQFKDVEEICENFAISSQDLAMIDDAEMASITEFKSKVDNALMSYSVAIQAAMKGELKIHLEGQRKMQMAFTHPLLGLIESLPDLEGEKLKATEDLIALYNKNIKMSKEVQEKLLKVKFIADIPNKKESARKYLKGKETKTYVEEIESELSELIAELKKRYSDFLSTPLQESDKGDLDE